MDSNRLAESGDSDFLKESIVSEVLHRYEKKRRIQQKTRMNRLLLSDGPIDDENDKQYIIASRNNLLTILKEKQYRADTYPSEDYFATYDFLLLLARRFPEQQQKDGSIQLSYLITPSMPSLDGNTVEAKNQCFIAANGMWFRQDEVITWYNNELKKGNTPNHPFFLWHDLARIRELANLSLPPPLVLSAKKKRISMAEFFNAAITGMGLVAIPLIVAAFLGAAFLAAPMAPFLTVGAMFGVALVAPSLYQAGKALFMTVQYKRAVRTFNEKINNSKEQITDAIQREKNMVSTFSSVKMVEMKRDHEPDNSREGKEMEKRSLQQSESFKTKPPVPSEAGMFSNKNEKDGSAIEERPSLVVKTKVGPSS